MRKSNKNLKNKFIKLYDQYHAGIYRFLRMRVKNEETAQDLTSESFTKAWDALSSGSAPYPQNARAYLYKVAYNSLIDYYRSAIKNKEVQIENQDFLVHLASAQTGPSTKEQVEKNIDISQDMDKIYLALQDMSDLSTDVITLKYIEDMSNSEIAGILDKSEGSVRTALSRAVQELKVKLSDADNADAPSN